jgi:general secretion pathway protein G
MSRRAHSAGFTLVELMVVVALIGILATLGLLTTQRLIQRAKAGATTTQMAFIRTGLLNFATNCEGLPLSARGGGDPGLAYRPAGSTCWNGPYIVRWPTTTSFGQTTTFQYVGARGSMAVLRARALSNDDARALAAQAAQVFGQAQLGGSGNARTVTVNIGNFYQR